MGLRVLFLVVTSLAACALAATTPEPAATAAATERVQQGVVIATPANDPIGTIDVYGLVGIVVSGTCVLLVLLSFAIYVCWRRANRPKGDYTLEPLDTVRVEKASSEKSAPK